MFAVDDPSAPRHPCIILGCQAGGLAAERKAFGVGVPGTMRCNCLILFSVHS